MARSARWRCATTSPAGHRTAAPSPPSTGPEPSTNSRPTKRGPPASAGLFSSGVAVWSNCWYGWWASDPRSLTMTRLAVFLIATLLSAAPAAPAAAQSAQELGQMRLYVQQLEERVRQLTGENERLSYELN